MELSVSEMLVCVCVCICYNYFDVCYKANGSILSLIKGTLSRLWSPLLFIGVSSCDDFRDFSKNNARVSNTVLITLRCIKTGLDTDHHSLFICKCFVFLSLGSTMTVATFSGLSYSPQSAC